MGASDRVDMKERRGRSLPSKVTFVVNLPQSLRLRTRKREKREKEKHDSLDRSDRYIRRSPDLHAFKHSPVHTI